MVGLLRILGLTYQVNVDVGVALAVLLALVDPWHLVAVFAVLVIVVMPAIVRMALLIEVVQDRTTVLLNFDDVLVADREEFDYLRQNAPSICIN